MTLLIFYLLLALAISFICSLTETVLLTSSLSYVNIRASEGSKGASIMKRMKQDIDKSLAAILSLNTVAHTVGASGVGAQATAIFGEAYFGWVSAILTILILLLSEILPKSIASRYWRSLLPLSGRLIGWMVIVAYPLVVASEFITKFFSARSSKETTISREEVSEMVNMGVEEGTFRDEENKIIQNLISLRSIKVESIMTPRVVVSTADEEMTIEEFYKDKTYLHFSRIPVYSKGNKEDITGFIFIKDVMERLANDQFGIKLREIKKPILVVPNSQPVTVLWEKLLSGRSHIALIVDEYGGFEGVVTMEDIIETLLGLEITDERDIVQDMQQYAREKWQCKSDKLS